MKKLLNAFSKEKVQKGIFIGMLLLVFGIFIVSIYVTDNSETPKEPDNSQNNNQNNNNQNNNENNNNNNQTPEPEKYKAPCDTQSCSVVRYFYSLKDDTATQEMSLIQVGSTYQMSKGITYKQENDSEFNVLATLSGVVTDINESPLYGNVIVIDHGENVKSEYISVSNIKVSVGDEVTQGEVICTSGSAEYDVASGNHLHFRVSVNGIYVDPQDLLNNE